MYVDGVLSDFSVSMVALSAASRGPFCEDEGPCYALGVLIQLFAIPVGNVSRHQIGFA